VRERADVNGRLRVRHRSPQPVEHHGRSSEAFVLADSQPGRAERGRGADPRIRVGLCPAGGPTRKDRGHGARRRCATTPAPRAGAGRVSRRTARLGRGMRWVGCSRPRTVRFPGPALLFCDRPRPVFAQERKGWPQKGWPRECGARRRSL